MLASFRITSPMQVNFSWASFGDLKVPTVSRLSPLLLGHLSTNACGDRPTHMLCSSDSGGKSSLDPNHGFVPFCGHNEGIG